MTVPITAAPKTPLRIAVLEADHPLDGTAAKYGTYGDVFAQLLRSAARALAWDADATLEITKFDVERQLAFPADLSSIDAILITGSRANAFDDTPWIVRLTNYVREVLETQSRVRVVGVCFGHQIVARAMGVKVDRSPVGWEASVTELPLLAKGSEIFDGREMVVCFPPPPPLLPWGCWERGVDDEW
jgi:GMP synthase-like glutamine amidotransferase